MAELYQNCGGKLEKKDMGGIAKSGARGALNGYETAAILSGSQTIGIDSPDCIVLQTAGAVELTFVPGAADRHAIKMAHLTAAGASTLTIAGAVWASNGSAPAWGSAGSCLLLSACFVAGRVVLNVADNTE